MASDTTFVSDIIASQRAMAEDRISKSDTYTSDAIAQSNGMSWVNGVDIASALDIPPPPALENMSSSELMNLYTGTKDDIANQLTGALDYFFTTFFPLGDELGHAQAWLTKALTTGGTGLNPAIEDQIWQRDRARLLKEGRRASEEAMSTWAARGYALPPGALVDQVARIDQDIRDKIAESSRTRAVEAARMELENIKFAIEKVISLRVEAIRASGDYIRSVALGPQLGAQLATSIASAKTALAESLTRMYSAQISALELPVRVSIAQGQLTMQAQTANLESFTKMAQVRTNTVMAAAQAAGSHGAAALNALSTQASYVIQG